MQTAKSSTPFLASPSRKGGEVHTHASVLAYAIPASHTSTSRVRRGVAQHVLSLLSTIFVISVLHLGLFATGDTLSYFADTESSLGNLLVADPVSFSVSGTTTIDIGSGSVYVIPLMTPSLDSEPLQFSVSAHMTGGDSALCSGLWVSATSSVVYDGPIVGLVTPMSTSTGEVPLFVTWDSPSSMPLGVACVVDFRFYARNADAPAGKGYSDEKIFSVQFFTQANLPPLIVEPMMPPQSQGVPLFVEDASTTPPVAEETTPAGTSTDPVTQVPEENSTSTPEKTTSDTENSEPRVQDPLPTEPALLPVTEVPQTPIEEPTTPLETSAPTTEAAPAV